jgi:hypothetical protein
MVGRIVRAPLVGCRLARRRKYSPRPADFSWSAIGADPRGAQAALIETAQAIKRAHRAAFGKRGPDETPRADIDFGNEPDACIQRVSAGAADAASADSTPAAK